MQRRNDPPRQSLLSKFRYAWRGLRRGVRSESNFFVHLFMAAMVIAAASVLRCTAIEWCLLVICIAAVLAAEMFNTAIEHLAKAIIDKHNPHIAGGLDMASAAVLLTSLGAGVVGVIVLGNRVARMLGWFDPM